MRNKINVHILDHPVTVKYALYYKEARELLELIKSVNSISVQHGSSQIQEYGTDLLEFSDYTPQLHIFLQDKFNRLERGN